MVSTFSRFFRQEFSTRETLGIVLLEFRPENRPKRTEDPSGKQGEFEVKLTEEILG